MTSIFEKSPIQIFISPNSWKSDISSSCSSIESFNETNISYHLDDVNKKFGNIIFLSEGETDIATSDNDSSSPKKDE